MLCKWRLWTWCQNKCQRENGQKSVRCFRYWEILDDTDATGNAGLPIGNILKPIQDQSWTAALELYIFIPFAYGSWPSTGLLGWFPLSPQVITPPDVRAKKSVLGKVILVWNSLLLSPQQELMSAVRSLLPKSCGAIRVQWAEVSSKSKCWV